MNHLKLFEDLKRRKKNFIVQHTINIKCMLKDALKFNIHRSYAHAFLFKRTISQQLSRVVFSFDNYTYD